MVAIFINPLKEWNVGEYKQILAQKQVPGPNAANTIVIAEDTIL
jgi:hypothetical protein